MPILRVLPCFVAAAVGVAPPVVVPQVARPERPQAFRTGGTVASQAPLADASATAASSGALTQQAERLGGHLHVVGGKDVGGQFVQAFSSLDTSFANADGGDAGAAPASPAARHGQSHGLDRQGLTEQGLVLMMFGALCGFATAAVLGSRRRQALTCAPAAEMADLGQEHKIAMAAFAGESSRSPRDAGGRKPATALRAAGVEADTSLRVEAKEVLEGMQRYFVDRLEQISADGTSCAGEFAGSSWVRDEGKHGGGQRFGTVETAHFNRASVNYSSVHYDDLPEKPVKSATALSVIIHPRCPYAPSMHCHFSYTEPRKRAPYWRMISDLNPSIHNPSNKNKFEKALKQVCPTELFDDAKLFGDKYFFIPELNIYRGTSHLFIAELSDDEMDADASRALAGNLARTTIDTYAGIIQEMMNTHPADSVTDRDRAQQLAYHTAYFYQVLFLDCGTTAGLMTHSDNDVGTLASLPSYIDVDLLNSWLEEKVHSPHDILLRRILKLLPESKGPCHVTDDVRAKLAVAVREYYLEDASRKEFQADMDLAWWAKRAA